MYISFSWASQVVLVVKNLPAHVGGVRDLSSIPGSGRSPGGGKGNPLQDSCLEKSHGQRSLVDYNPWIGISLILTPEKRQSIQNANYIF